MFLPIFLFRVIQLYPASIIGGIPFQQFLLLFVVAFLIRQGQNRLDIFGRRRVFRLKVKSGGARRINDFDQQFVYSCFQSQFDEILIGGNTTITFSTRRICRSARL